MRRLLSIAAGVACVGVMAALHQGEVERLAIEDRHIVNGMSDSFGRFFDTAELASISIREDADDERWHAWDRISGYNAMRRYTGLTLPVRHMLLMDRHGVQQYTSFAPDVDHKDFSWRPYFKALADGAPYYYYGPYVGGNTGRPTYAGTYPLTDKKGEFDGLLLVAMDVEYMDEVCRSELHQRYHVGMLLTETGQVLATCNLRDAATMRSVEVTWHQMMPVTEGVQLLPGVAATGGSVIYINKVRAGAPLYAVLITDLSGEMTLWWMTTARNVLLMLLLAAMLLLPLRRRGGASTDDYGPTTSTLSGSAAIVDSAGHKVLGERDGDS